MTPGNAVWVAPDQPSTQILAARGKKMNQCLVIRGWLGLDQETRPGKPSLRPFIGIGLIDIHRRLVSGQELFSISSNDMRY